VGYFGFQQYQNSFEMSFAKNAWPEYQYLGLGLTWNIFTGFSNSNNLKGTIVQKRIAEENYTAAKDQGAINDSLLLDNYFTYNNMVTTSQNTYDLYGKNMDLSLQKFREGLISIDSYFKTFQDYLAAENTYLNNLANLLTTKANIEARTP
jgi:outer membrane protein TolC